jgi:hypothetical protein
MKAQEANTRADRFLTEVDPSPSASAVSSFELLRVPSWALIFFHNQRQ